MLSRGLLELKLSGRNGVTGRFGYDEEREQAINASTLIGIQVHTRWNEGAWDLESPEPADATDADLLARSPSATRSSGSHHPITTAIRAPQRVDRGALFAHGSDRV